MSNHRFGDNSKPYNRRLVKHNIQKAPRSWLLQFCKWNDSNGDYDEAPNAALRSIILDWCDDNQETPEEIIALSRKPYR